jgi:hypothetical protein
MNEKEKKRKRNKIKSEARLKKIISEKMEESKRTRK